MKDYYNCHCKHGLVPHVNALMTPYISRKNSAANNHIISALIYFL